MRIVVLGGGVVGVSTAYFLARAGHEVTVVDRQATVARETSFANAGLIAPGHSYTWNSPRAPLILLKSLWRDDMALRFHLRADPRMWAWSLRFLANCTAERSRRYTVIKLKLCLYSQHVLGEIARDAGIAYDAVDRGLLYLYRSREHLALGVGNMALLNDHGARLEAIDPDRCVAIEPALAHARDKLAGAVYAPGDASGDSRLFTEGLAEYWSGTADHQHEMIVRDAVASNSLLPLADLDRQGHPRSMARLIRRAKTSEATSAAMATAIATSVSLSAPSSPPGTWVKV